MIRPPPFSAGQRIGLFGGSFNPPHEGHRAVALQALKALDLDWVWWVLSPQNPLKDKSETEDFAERLRHTRRIARHPRFMVTDLERRLATLTTAALLARLRAVLAQGRFVWIMGADSFAGLHRWNDWAEIPETLPLAVFARPAHSIRALRSPAALRYGAQRIPQNEAQQLPGAAPPAWCFLPMPLRQESSTALRRRRHGIVAA